MEALVINVDESLKDDELNALFALSWPSHVAGLMRLAPSATT